MSLLKKLKLNLPNEENNCDNEAESPYFLPCSSIQIISDINQISNNLLKIESSLILKLKDLKFTKSPVDCIYNPLEYAFESHSMFVNKYCRNRKKVLFLGLNPGPWGMAQTGVPFGEVNLTKNWLKINGAVNKPKNEISARPVTGFDCSRSEISGKRFWSLFQNICGLPDNFFKYSYVHNYCPLLLMKNDGVNVTPADLKKNESAQLQEICNESLNEVINLLQIEIIIGVGRFAQKRAEETIKTYSLNNIRVHFLIHPSPRIPKNENWEEKTKQTLQDLNLLQYFTQ